MKLIIVESPTKAKTISKFLGKEYKVTASYGHIRDLPEKTMGVDVEHNYQPTYIIPEDKQEKIDELQALVKKAKLVILATDEDREGEAIAWHLTKALDITKEKNAGRIVFHEITKSAILHALETPRDLNMHLVDAQQARRILDRLVGYELSPFLWNKVARGLSAGRVQSVAVRLIVEREREITAFKPEEYWSILAHLHTETDTSLPVIATLVKMDGKSLDKLEIKNEAQSKEILEKLQGANYVISHIAQKEVTRSPYAPFTTSTLQQEASRKHGFGAKMTMMIAQKLYEHGFITYMRTDSVNLASQAVTQIRDYIKQNFEASYLPADPIQYKTKSKGAQEAHEAIRPTDMTKVPEMMDMLDARQRKVYALIWQRTIACQMAPAVFASTSVDIEAKNFLFRANGSILKFPGFMSVYPTKTKDALLPVLTENQKLDLDKVEPLQHFTQPPARYTEASLIKALEEHGIGRPSTYAPTLATIQDRKYVEKNELKKLVPTDIGMLVNDVLVKHFPDIVDIDFTAHVEEDFDEVADGKKEWEQIIDGFYKPFKKNLEKKKKEVDKKELTETASTEKCPKCGSAMVIKVGRFGKFLACSNYPDCKTTLPLDKDNKIEEPEKSGEKCDKCGHDMIVKHGRFGKFMACSNYPTCKNIKSIIEKVGVKCPACQNGDIIARRGKSGKPFYGCSNYPDCKFALWSKPTGELCPQCSSLLVFGPKETIKCSNKECGFKKEAPEKKDEGE